MYKNYSSGRHCAIVGCKNNQRKRKLVMDENCAEHLCKRRVCMCGVYSLHRFPAAPEKCREWEIALNRKNFKPSKLARVCSVHFIDGKPTALNPCPMLKLGYAKKVTRGRRPILRTLQPKAASVQIMDSQSQPESRRKLLPLGLKTLNPMLIGSAHGERSENPSYDSLGYSHKPNPINANRTGTSNTCDLLTESKESNGRVS
ncbi:uncharacterized protein LOC144133183 isoform X1 [Amblyomma americanum]